MDNNDYRFYNDEWNDYKKNENSNLKAEIKSYEYTKKIPIR